MIEMTTHPRDPWRYHRAEQAGCEALLAQALDAALQGRELEAGTRAAILADTGLAAGRVMDATIAAYTYGLEGDLTRARREVRLLRDPANARTRLARTLDLYVEELGQELWDRVVRRLALELVEVHRSTQEVLLRRLEQGDRRSRRVALGVGRA